MNKVKLLLLLALSATMSFGAMAQAGGEKAPLSIGTNGELQEVISSDIQFTEETFDFGELDEGPLVTHEFKFKNTGKESLTMTNVKASCGCTTPEWPKDPIAPNGEGTIKVTYNTKGRVGPFNKAITITSNAAEPTSRIYIKGTVKAAPVEQTMPVKVVSPIMNAE